MKINKPEDLNKTAEKSLKLLTPSTCRITVGTATCGIAKGADTVIKALLSELKKQKVKADIVKVGCNGMCFAEPVVEVIQPNKPRITYGHVNKGQAADIVKALSKNKIAELAVLLRYDEYRSVICSEPVKYLKGKLSKTYAGVSNALNSGFFKNQTKFASRNAGTICPEKIEEYIALGGYKALAQALASSPENTIEEVKNSKLRGRGGAAFPTGIKWDACRNAQDDKKYIVCNGSEGDPEIGMHRSFLESDPHTVIEGMITAGYCTGASEGYIYLNDRYLLAFERVQTAIKQAKQLGLLGRNIMGSGFSFAIRIKRGGGAYICGEETALLNSIEGSFGEPRTRPPFPVEKGLFGQPTVINNIETLANIPVIVLMGGKKFAKTGTPSSSGSKIISLTGNVKQSCWAEVAFGTKIEDIIKIFAKGTTGSKKIKAFQTGGPSGGLLPAKFLKTKLDYDALSKAGTILGSGGLLIMDEGTDMVDMAKFLTEFFADESCGKCTSCREGIKRLLDIMDDITDGKGTRKHLELITRMDTAMHDTCFCALGKTAAVPLVSVIKHFSKDIESLIH